uniref:hypothetical protein n=1 Tax=Xenorhabdus entomophaga TaxID=3136257 RepID=UPI0030F3B918
MTAKDDFRLPLLQKWPERKEYINTFLKQHLRVLFLLYIENPQLGWGFRRAYSYKSAIKTPFDLLKHLAVWQL